MSMKGIAALTAGLLVTGLSAEAAASHQSLGSGQQVRTQLTASHQKNDKMKKNDNGCKDGICPVVEHTNGDDEDDNGEKKPSEGACGEGTCGG